MDKRVGVAIFLAVVGLTLALTGYEDLQERVLLGPGPEVGGVEPGENCVNSGQCNDGIFCNGQEICNSNGQCEISPIVDCSFYDGQCTTGICDEEQDQCVQQTTNENQQCDDGLFCTSGETCQAGSCEPNSPTCAPGESCDENQDTCETLPASCQQNSDCDDGNSCTTDSCIDNTCTNTNKPNGNSCEDGLFCTQNSLCTNGVCNGGEPIDCSADECNYGVCDEETQSCTLISIPGACIDEPEEPEEPEEPQDNEEPDTETPNQPNIPTPNEDGDGFVDEIIDGLPETEKIEFVASDILQGNKIIKINNLPIGARIKFVHGFTNEETGEESEEEHTLEILDIFTDTKGQKRVEILVQSKPISAIAKVQDPLYLDLDKESPTLVKVFFPTAKSDEADLELSLEEKERNRFIALVTFVAGIAFMVLSLILFLWYTVRKYVS